MIIRKAHKKDLNDIMKMYKSCVCGMIKNNIDQWDASYPNSEIIKVDIAASTYYIAEINKKIIGGINIDQNQDPTYLKISWKDKSNSFLVVHRLAVEEESWGENIGKKLMVFTESLVREKKLKSVRLDTYSGNPKAINFYKRLKYEQLGHINLKPNKNEYYCFEKLIS